MWETDFRCINNKNGDCTYRLQTKKSRGDPTRTGDHLVPNQVRYQLRYTPMLITGIPRKAVQIYVIYSICPKECHILFRFLSLFLQSVANSVFFLYICIL